MLRKKTRPLSPLARYLIEYVEENETSLTALSRQAGLSPGALRYIIHHAERVPTIETCLKLSHVTGKAPTELMQLGGMTPETTTELENIHPWRMELLRLYDDLPLVLQQALVEMARALHTLRDGEGNHGS